MRHEFQSQNSKCCARNLPAWSNIGRNMKGQANEVNKEAVAGDAPAGTFFDYSVLHILTIRAGSEQIESRGLPELAAF